jgi:hypothetical protein
MHPIEMNLQLAILHNNEKKTKTTILMLAWAQKAYFYA